MGLGFNIKLSVYEPFYWLNNNEFYATDIQCIDGERRSDDVSAIIYILPINNEVIPNLI
jgi:hypothetical protein